MNLLGTMIYDSDKMQLLKPGAVRTNMQLAQETNKIFWPTLNNMIMGDYNNKYRQIYMASILNPCGSHMKTKDLHSASGCAMRSHGEIHL